jgi:ketosteroid isomerase-like protein
MSTRERVLDLIEYVKAGRIVDAIQEFYADAVIMQENRHPATVGKPANLARERAFAESIAHPHEVIARAVVVDGDEAIIEWVFDFTTRGGQRIRMEEIAQQTWRQGRIERERFFFDPASVVEASEVREVA